MPIQTARKSTGGYWPPTRPPPPKCGIPKLATYEPPPPPARSLPRLRKKPGAKKRTTIKKTVKAEAAESPESFNLLGLPAELRNTIYEICVSVSNYITYNDRDFCTCGKPFIDDGTDEDHDKDGSSCTFKVQRLDDLDEMCFPRLIGRFMS